MSKVLFREGSLIRTMNACTKFASVKDNYKASKGAACANCTILDGELLCLHTAMPCDGKGVHKFTPAKQLLLEL